MTVASIATTDRLYRVSGTGYAPEGTFSLNGQDLDPAKDKLLTEIARAGLLWQRRWPPGA